MLPWLLAFAVSSQLQSTPYDLDPVPHLVASGGMIAVVGIAEAVVKPALQGAYECALTPAGDRCDALHLWGLDRYVVGNNSLVWRRLSDAGALATFAGAAAFTLYDNFASDSLTPGGDAATDMLVVGESVVLATFLTHTLKYAVRRPRPGQYSPGTPTLESELSFPSGHVSSTAAAATAYTMTFFLRHPESPWRFALLGGGAALTAVTGLGRVNGGMHFWSDVTAGAILGTTVGFLVPYLNRRHATVLTEVAPDVAGGTRWGIGLQAAY
jgi:membrane-associated phospholipid phosphatase